MSTYCWLTQEIYTMVRNQETVGSMLFAILTNWAHACRDWPERWLPSGRSRWARCECGSSFRIALDARSDQMNAISQTNSYSSCPMTSWPSASTSIPLTLASVTVMYLRLS